MHFYLYGLCTRPGCGLKLFVLHTEGPDTLTDLEYPDRYFPVQVTCPDCRRVNSFGVKDLRSECVPFAHHPDGWKPILPFPPEKPQGND